MEDYEKLREKWEALYAIIEAGEKSPIIGIDEDFCPLWTALFAMLPLPAPRDHLVLCAVEVEDGDRPHLVLFDVDRHMDCSVLALPTAVVVRELHWMAPAACISRDVLTAVMRTADGLMAYE